MREIKKIKNLSLAKITAAIYGLVGFFIALAVAIFTMANIVMQNDFNGSVFFVALFNLGAGILLGLAVAAVMAVLGWILGFITAAFYNLFAARLGGIKIELAESKTEAKKESKADGRTEGDGSAEEENKINYFSQRLIRLPRPAYWRSLAFGHRILRGHAKGDDGAGWRKIFK